MNTVTFIRDYARVCSSYHCADCPLRAKCLNSGDCGTMTKYDIDRLINAVDEWSKAHPMKTRLMDFLEKYPKAQVNGDGTPHLCAKTLGYVCNCPPVDRCKECWNTSLEE